MDQKLIIKNLVTVPTKVLLPINKSQLFKLNFDILMKSKKDYLKKIARDLGENNISSRNDKHLNKDGLVNIILNNDNYIWTTNEIEIETLKQCSKCYIKKSFDSFYKDKKIKDKFSSYCKECQSNYYDSHNKTLNRYLKSLLSNSKSSAKKRKNKGRIEAGVFNITIEDLKDLWIKQNSKCYYSNIPMNYDKRDWKVSLERLDPDNKGYEKDNIVLCCQEFNGRSQWSKEKIKEMIDILNEDIVRHTFTFDLENFEYKISPRRYLQNFIRHSKSSTKRRIKKNNKKRNNSFDIDFDYLVELYNDQRGLCAYSGLPLQFGSYLEKNWTCSLERIDVLKGYTKGNACLICYEFNTPDRTINCKNEEKGSCGWNKEKFKIFLNNCHLN